MMFRSTRFRQFLLLSLTLCACGGLHAQTMAWTHFTHPDGSAWFRIPADMEPGELIRGIYIQNPPSIHAEAFAHRNRMAVMSSGLTRNDFAAEALASGHPELRNAGRISWGISAGSFNVVSEVNKIPEKMIGIMTHGDGTTPDSSIPVLIGAGAADNIFDIAMGWKMYTTGGQSGTGMFFSPHSFFYINGHHTDVQDQEYIGHWLEELLKVRLPESLPDDGSAPELRRQEIRRGGWLARADRVLMADYLPVNYGMANFEIGPAQDFPGGFARSYWWFPTERSAREWVRRADFQQKRHRTLRSGQDGNWGEDAVWNFGTLNNRENANDPSASFPPYGFVPPKDFHVQLAHDLTLSEGVAKLAGLSQVSGETASLTVSGGVLDLSGIAELNYAGALTLSGGDVYMPPYNKAASFVSTGARLTPLGPERFGPARQNQTVLQSGATLAIGIADIHRHDQLRGTWGIQGPRMEDGSSIEVTLADGFTPQVGDAFDILRGSGAVSVAAGVTAGGPDGHKFTMVSSSDNRRLRLIYNPQGLALNNQPPLADLTVSNNTIQGNAPLALTFNASGSSDPDGNIVSYEWDFGDGATASGGTSRSHTYTREGQFVATVTVTDDQGARNSAAWVVTVGANPTLKKPYAYIRSNRVSGTPNTVFEVDGSRSWDEDGQIVGYEWRMGDDVLGTGPVMELHFDEPGAYELFLTVTDNDGLTHTNVVDIHIYPAATVRGRVTLGGEPLANTAVWIGGWTPTKVYTRADGTYEVEIGLGKHELWVEVSPGRHTPLQAVEPTQAGQVIENVDMEIHRLSLSGTVLHEETGLPVPDAVLSTTGLFEDTFQAGPDGTFSIERLSGITGSISLIASQTHLLGDAVEYPVPVQQENLIIYLRSAYARTSLQPGTLSVSIQQGQNLTVDTFVSETGMNARARWGLRVQSDQPGDSVAGHILRSLALIPTDIYRPAGSFFISMLFAGYDYRQERLWQVYILRNQDTNITEYIYLTERDAVTGALLRQLDISTQVNQQQVQAMTWDPDSGHILLATANTAEIVEFDITGAEAQVLRRIPVQRDPDDSSQTALPVSSLAAGNGLWYVRKGNQHTDRRIFILDPVSGAELGVFNLPQTEGTNSSTNGRYGIALVNDKLIAFRGSNTSPRQIYKANPRTGSGEGGFGVTFGTTTPHYAAAGPHHTAWMYWGGSGAAIALVDTGEPEWLRPGVRGGNLPAGERITVPLEIDTAHLPVGTHTATVTLRANTENPNAASTLHLTVHVTEGPAGAQGPAAVINAQNTGGSAPLTVTADALDSYDPDGNIVQYVWNFGDGSALVTTDSPAARTHTYTAPGNYTLSLTVTDNDGLTSASSVAVSVVESQVTLSTPVLDTTPALTSIRWGMSLGDAVPQGGLMLDPNTGASVSGTFTVLNPSFTPESPGSLPVQVRFVPSNPSAYNTVDMDLELTVLKALADLFHPPDDTQPYTGTPKTVSVGTNPVGLPLTFVWSSGSAPVNVGQYQWTATVDHEFYEGSVQGQLTIYMPDPPEAPGSLSAVALPNGNIQLAWTDNSQDETGFEIQTSSDGESGWSLLHTTAASVTGYTHTGLASGTTVFYRVRGVNAGGSSEYTQVASAQTLDSAGGEGAFHPFQYDDGNGNTLYYQLWIPADYDPALSYPLILSLHGAGSRTNENPDPLTGGYPTVALVTEAVQSYQPHFILHPWCPVGQQWVNTGFGSGTYDQNNVAVTPQMTAVLAIVDQVIATYEGIDPDRVLVTGVSMGGYGSMDALTRRPDLWAGALVVCGGAPAPQLATGVTGNTPVWLTHGDQDNIVPVSGSRNAVTALLDAGGRVRYTEFPGVGHDAWTPTFSDPAHLEWLLRQRRNAPDPTHAAPQIDPGADTELTLPLFSYDPASGVSSDAPAADLSLFWDIKSGPGRPSFVPLNSATPTITFPKTGTYVLRLAADDMEQTVHQEVIVTVSTASGALPDLLAHWHFDEGQGTLLADTTGQNLTGTTARSDGWSTDTPAGTGHSLMTRYQVGGGTVNNYAVIPNNPYLAPTDNTFSVSMWLKADSWADFILNKPGFINISVTGNDLRVTFYDNGNGAWFQFPRPGVTGEWMHFAFTYDGASGRAYYDGALAYTGNRVFTLGSSISPLILGAERDAGNAKPFRGRIDEVRLHNTVLSLEEIQSVIDSDTQLDPGPPPVVPGVGTRFPPDSGVIDVTQPPYNAVPNDGNDDTSAIQAALDAYPNGNRIIYLPAGVYNISQPLTWPETPGEPDVRKRTILQGEGKDSTVLLFHNPAVTAGPVLLTGGGAAQNFRNGIRDLTVRIAPGNSANLDGVAFVSNNQGTLRNVRIESSDRAGRHGLELAMGENGPLLIHGVEVIGFDIGIHAANTVVSQTLEHIRLREQNVTGIWVRNQALFIRGLHSRGERTVAHTQRDTQAFLTLIDAHMEGTGSASTRPAIFSDKTGYFRNIRSSGYQATLEHDDKNRGNTGGVPGPYGAEFLSHGSAQSAFADHGDRSLGLEIRDTPSIPWDPLSAWQGPHQHGGTANDPHDDTAALQAAMNSGASTIYLPNGSWILEGTVTVPPTVRRIIGCEARIQGSGRFVVNSGGSDPVIFERFQADLASGVVIEHGGDRPVVLSALLDIRYVPVGSPGDLYLEDVNFGAPVTFRNQRVWARQLNVETDTQSSPEHEARVLADNADLWVLGLKTERAGTVIKAVNNSRVELLGAYILANTHVQKNDPIFHVVDSAASFSGTTIRNFGTPDFQTFVRETRGGITLDTPRESAGLLHTAYPAVTSPNPPVAVGDSATVAQGTSVGIPVLANDTDADGDTLRLIGYTVPAHGRVRIENGLAVYTPDPDHLGTDAFYYQIHDGRSGWDQARVDVITTSPEDETPPTLVSAAGSVAGGILLTYSEPVHPDTALDPANYQILPAVAIHAVTPVSPSSVQIDTDPFSQGTSYSLTVNNVTDFASEPNVIAPDSAIAIDIPVIPDSGLAIAATAPDSGIVMAWADTAGAWVGQYPGGIRMVAPHDKNDHKGQRITIPEGPDLHVSAVTLRVISSPASHEGMRVFVDVWQLPDANAAAPANTEALILSREPVVWPAATAVDGQFVTFHFGEELTLRSGHTYLILLGLDEPAGNDSFINFNAHRHTRQDQGGGKNPHGIMISRSANNGSGLSGRGSTLGTWSVASEYDLEYYLHGNEAQAPDAYAVWAASVFTPGQLADPDGDGIPNRLERAFGGHPLHAGTAQLPYLQNGVPPVLRYRRDAGDLSYTVEQSPSLAPADWQPAPGASTPGENGWWVREIPVLPETTPLFLRVRVFE
ncbi:MAG: PKD domain-containing protein [Verrucomicrobia bacterium]|nr:PKD domain-containing protein [Verrucomicrobiota bacterium]MCH8513105.1 PKD domain-containing protein [Kiritimatiellia bacterium]